MKNVHIIPTDKPSKLLQTSFELLLLDIPSNKWKYPNVNIYITSTEEIKEGDWFIRDNSTHKCFKVHKTDIEFLTSIDSVYCGSNTFWSKEFCKKIILTTDEDLIANGVQHIDDEFLEWLINNPNCEEVEIYYDTQSLRGEIWKYDYQIIIPKKESEQVCEHDIVTKFGVAECQNCGIEESEILKDKLKQETAKYQAEQMYSEEEVYDIVSKTVNQLQLHFNENLKNQIIDELFKQFKK